MLYLKKLCNEKGESLNIIEAKIAIAEGKNISATISENTRDNPKKTSFVVKGVTGIIEAEGCFIIKTAEGVFPTSGWDKKLYEIKVLFFADYTEREALESIENAKMAVAFGHDVRAISKDIQTSTILSFLENDLFETCYGSRYKIIK